jgi:RNA polymerase sigma-70 factor, ECF subfamily
MVDIAALYAAHWSLVYGFLRRRLRYASHEDVEDLTATVFVHVVRFSERYHDEGKETAWLVTIARHALIDDIRRLRPETVPLVSDAPGGRSTSDAGSERQVTALTVARALTRLTDRQQVAIVDRYYMGAPAADTALVLGCSQEAVKQHRKLALRRLRRELGGAARGPH